jgi:uncharacterized damage-inducible protein DinB
VPDAISAPGRDNSSFRDYTFNMVTTPPDVWLRGPVYGIPALLMPVAHSLLQAREDVAHAANGLSDKALWTRPGGAASAGFHLYHMAHSLDRLMTYARGESLQDPQRTSLALEKSGEVDATADDLIDLVAATIDRALRQLRCTPEASLAGERRIGRALAPSTVLGILFHAAEHTTRHAGQLITTIKVVTGRSDPREE